MTNLRLKYQTIEFGNIDIHVCTLRDKQEFDDPNGHAEKLGICSASWPMFGVIWPSSMVLSHYMSSYDTGSKRILEVGCGMALSSLLLNQKHADITATDYHPEAQKFLQRNISLNHARPITFRRIDWADKQQDLGLFDVIIGSDLLYEDEHILLLANFIESHAKPTCEIILTDPGRGRKNKISVLMKQFGYRSSHFKPEHTNYLSEQFKGHILKFER